MESLAKPSLNALLQSALAKRWRSDLECFTIESRFLHHLFEDYLMAFNSDAYQNQLKELERRLTALEKQRKGYTSQVNKQLSLVKKQQGAAGDRPFNQRIKKEALDLEGQIMGFTEQFRNLKKELFEFVEQAERTHERFDLCR